MKIDAARPSRTQAPRRGERSGRSAGGDFAHHVAAEVGTASAPPAHSITQVHPLAFLPDIPDAGQGAQRRAKARAEGLLERLDEIRHALLTGDLSQARLEALTRQINQERPAVIDPMLRETLDAIDLRARVELAKYAGRR